MNPKTASFVLFAGILGFCLMVSLPLHAQVTGATISGTITDASGGVIVGAEISVRNTATGINRNTTTDSAGFYTVPNLNPGPYEVKVTAKGFTTAVQSNLTLAVGAQQSLNIPMKVGETSQTVQVTEAAPQIELTSSTISDQIESTTVTELPLNGRDWASLATLSPGVNAVEVQMPFETGARRGNRGFGAQLTISGGKPTQNNYRLDGLSINDYANGGPGSVLGVNLGVDAIQEFSVLTGNYSAEYGRASAGIVNAISKSGTNAFHGDLYGFLRSQKLDANDFFSNLAKNPTRPPYKRNQFGAAAGGPIRKERTFIFGDYEGVRQVQGLPSASSRVPSDDARLGILTGPGLTAQGKPAGTPCTNPAPRPGNPGNTTPGHYLSPLATICVDDNSARYLALFPTVPGSTGMGNTVGFIFPVIGVINENFFTARVDHKISDKDSLFGTYLFDNTPDTNPDGFNNVQILSQTKRQIAALEWSHVFSPAMVNSARFGFNRANVANSNPTAAINPASKDPSLGMFLGRNAPAIFSAGIAQLQNGYPGGTTTHIWNSFQFYDDAFLTRGTHSLKFGFAVERMQYNPTNFYQPNGIVRFGGSLRRFLTNQVKSLEGSRADRLTGRSYRQTLYGGYVQDDWHWRRNLTLNLGLRYEMTTVLTETVGRYTNLRNITDAQPYCGTTDLAITNVFGNPGCSSVAPYYSNPTTKNFEPRVGFSWDPRGDGKTAIRGGFAIFDILPLPGYFYSQGWAPFLLTATVADSAVTPLSGTLGVDPATAGSAYSFLGPTKSATCTSPLGTCTLTGAYVDPNSKRNYVEQWNINVQRQITPTLTASVGYVGSHGVHMSIRGDDFDMVLPTLTSAGYLWPNNPTGTDMRINKNFGLIRGMTFGTDSTYKALEVNVQKRMSHGFQFGGSYTYSTAKDDDSGTILGDAFSNSITTWFWFAPKISRAVSDYNITHTAIINGLWQVPAPKSLHGPFAYALARGWELGGVFKMNSGIPTTPIIGGDPLGVQNNGSDTFGIPDRVPGCDPVNHNFKSNGLNYINTNCFKVPMAPADAAIASQCVPFSAVPGSCSNLLGNAGRNSIVGPKLVNLDFSVYKNFALMKISESSSLQFRAEFFNILNHANFGVPAAFTGGGTAQILSADGTVTSGAGQLPQPTVTKPRDIQLALKLIW
jgi:outer membrane receptor protein involved in Fe transport